MTPEQPDLFGIGSQQEKEETETALDQQTAVPLPAEKPRERFFLPGLTEETAWPEVNK